MRRHEPLFTRRKFLGGVAGGVAAALLPLRAQVQNRRPNFLVIYTDDQSVEMVRWMPALRRLVGDTGARFSRAYCEPVCGPSRATVLTGLQVHNHKVYENNESGEKLRSTGGDRDTLATRLKALGYRTGFFGKYMNWSLPSYVPPGWDRFVMLTKPHNRDSYPVAVNGNLRWVYRSNWNETDYIADKADDFVRSPAGSPWLACLWPHSPHNPSTPAPRNRGWAADHGVRIDPDKPSIPEADLSDKLSWLRKRNAPGQDDLSRVLRGMVDELQDVEDAIRRLIGTLAAMGQLANTFVVFAADNGYLFGEHGREGKNNPYREAATTPLVARGPGVAAGSVVDAPVHLTDLAPTLCDLAGAPYEDLDGRSLAPLLRGETPPKWRERVFVESFYRYPSWVSVHEGDLSYTRDMNGAEMLFDHATDPYELASSHRETDPAELARLRDLAGRFAGTKETPGPRGADLRTVEEEAS